MIFIFNLFIIFMEHETIVYSKQRKFFFGWKKKDRNEVKKKRSF